jgi:hypothetical protein
VEITPPARTLADVADAGVDPSVVVEGAARALDAGPVTSGELRETVKRRPARVRRLVERAIREADPDA